MYPIEGSSSSYIMKIQRINSFGFKEVIKWDMYDIPKSMIKQGWKKIKD